MENLFLSNSFSIIGKESQTIQIILNKNNKININKMNVLSSSTQELSEILYKDNNLILGENIGSSSSETSNNDNMPKINNPFIVTLKNKNTNYEYISLSRGGKIMKIIPSLYSNLYIRLDSLLAFNIGVEIVQDKKKDQELIKYLRGNIIRKNIKNLIGGDELLNQKQYGLIKLKSSNFNKNPIDNILLKASNYINDLVFISGKKNLIEKRLGKNEKLIILIDSLIAFEDSISFDFIKSNKLDKYVNHVNDIIVEGPGLIILEPCERIIPIVNKKWVYGLLIATVITLFLELIVQLFLSNELRI